jgi:quercetin dioxygenase-like cupin family protein
MRPLFRTIKCNVVPMSPLRFIGMALVLALGSLPISSVRAADSAAVTPLMLKELTDIPGKEMLMITVDYPPGAVDPVHRHEAHAFVYVLQGSIVMQVRGGKEVTLVPGQTFYEGPNDVAHGRSQCEHDGASKVHRDSSEEEGSRRGVARRVIRLASAGRNEGDCPARRSWPSSSWCSWWTRTRRN